MILFLLAAYLVNAFIGKRITHKITLILVTYLPRIECPKLHQNFNFDFEVRYIKISPIFFPLILFFLILSSFIPNEEQNYSQQLTLGVFVYFYHFKSHLQEQRFLGKF